MRGARQAPLLFVHVTRMWVWGSAVAFTDGLFPILSSRIDVIESELAGVRARAAGADAREREGEGVFTLADVGGLRLVTAPTVHVVTGPIVGRVASGTAVVLVEVDVTAWVTAYAIPRSAVSSPAGAPAETDAAVAAAAAAADAAAGGGSATSGGGEHAREVLKTRAGFEAPTGACACTVRLRAWRPGRVLFHSLELVRAGGRVPRTVSCVCVCVRARARFFDSGGGVVFCAQGCTYDIVLEGVSVGDIAHARASFAMPAACIWQARFVRGVGVPLPIEVSVRARALSPLDRDVAIYRRALSFMPCTPVQAAPSVVTFHIGGQVDMGPVAVQALAMAHGFESLRVCFWNHVAEARRVVTCVWLQAMERRVFLADLRSRVNALVRGAYRAAWAAPDVRSLLARGSHLMLGSEIDIPMLPPDGLPYAEDPAWLQARDTVLAVMRKVCMRPLEWVPQCVRENCISGARRVSNRAVGRHGGGGPGRGRLN